MLWESEWYELIFSTEFLNKKSAESLSKSTKSPFWTRICALEAAQHGINPRPQLLNFICAGTAESGESNGMAFMLLSMP
ncbi:MAG: hypothetical protein ACD_39C00726G0002 [uncultured bacterium]|nr:MAG: hypothetical protein ACD_39C00726G0002 [uncultured bacterium]